LTHAILYGDTNVTRFYLSHKNKIASRKHIEKFKQVWQICNICFIEGGGTRLGVGNDLFSNAEQIIRIICPSNSAFDYYDEIFVEASKLPKDTLFVLALGMSATVLAVDLSEAGYQAIDVGYIDIEYEWMKVGATKKVAIPTKYTNEVAGGQTPINIENIEYNDQIIVKIGCNL